MKTSEIIHNQYAKALDDHQQGRFNEARIGYLEILKWIPHAEALWALLGTVMNQLGQNAQGIQYLSWSLRLAPYNPATRSNLGNALRESGDLVKATNHLKLALSLQPEFSEAYINLGRAYLALNDPVAGARVIEQSLKILPHEPKVLNALGIAMSQAGLSERALTCLRSAIVLDPSSSQSYIHYGELQIPAGQFSQAVDTFNQAIWADPSAYLAYLGRGSAYHALHEYQNAICDFDVVLESNDALALRGYLARAASLICLGNGSEGFEYYSQAEFLGGDAVDIALGKAQACSCMEKHHKAMTYAKRAIALCPERVLSYLIFGNILYEQGDNAMALQLFGRATHIEKDNAEAYVNQSIIHLKSGHFETGWALYAKRLETRSITTGHTFLSKKACEPDFSADKLWIWYEQGVGDQVFFCGILNDIKNEFKNIIVTLDYRLIPIFERSFSEITFTDQTKIPESAYDGHLPMANLPLVFRKFLGEPRPESYIKSDSQRVQAIRSALLQRGKALCGLSWESQRKDRGREKSIDLIDLLPILEIANIKFVNLQYGDVSTQLAELERKTGAVIHQFSDIDNQFDLDGLTCLIDACDFVVSTCNSTAHFAGALGKETYLLAPLRGKAQQWYWAPFGTPNSPWYPSIAIFHQGEGRDWRTPIRKIHQAISRKWALGADA